jgi:hypothetical protein
VERLVQQLGDSRVLVATLMAEINILHQEKALKDSQQSLATKRYLGNHKITKLQRSSIKSFQNLEPLTPLERSILKSLFSLSQAGGRVGGFANISSQGDGTIESKTRTGKNLNDYD